MIKWRVESTSGRFLGYVYGTLYDGFLRNWVVADCRGRHVLVAVIR